MVNKLTDELAKQGSPTQEWTPTQGNIGWERTELH